MALDEVGLLKLVADQRTRLLDALPPGSSTAAAAAAASSVADVAGGGGGERGGVAGVSEAVKAAENEAAATAARAGAECIVRYFGHAIHKGLRGSLFSKVLYIVTLCRKYTRKCILTVKEKKSKCTRKNKSKCTMNVVTLCRGEKIAHVLGH